MCSSEKRVILISRYLKIYNEIAKLHKKERFENYFLRFEDDDEPFETSRLDFLIANQFGIFSLTEHRYVQEFSRFYAYGSGNEFALGAMYAIYNDHDKTAEDIVKIGISAGAEFR